MTRRRVLVALDASGSAERVAAFVNRFFEGLDVEVVGLHVASIGLGVGTSAPVFGWPYPPAGLPPLAAEVPTALDEQAVEAGHEAIARSGLIEDEELVEIGTVVDTIRRVALEREVDLVVLGSSHRGFLDRLLSPPVETELLRSPPCPVLVVP